MLDGNDPETLTLIVRNAGAIDADLMPHIFDPFRRGHAPSDRPKGLGLGLYIVQQIVKGHDGTIAVDSSPAEGTCFRVSLPRGEHRVVESAALA
jgi:signal transduction histidine kinase